MLPFFCNETKVGYGLMISFTANSSFGLLISELVDL